MWATVLLASCFYGGIFTFFNKTSELSGFNHFENIAKIYMSVCIILIYTLGLYLLSIYNKKLYKCQKEKKKIMGGTVYNNPENEHNNIFYIIYNIIIFITCVGLISYVIIF
jgi:uncharacterized membrane protein